MGAFRCILLSSLGVKRQRESCLIWINLLEVFEEMYRCLGTAWDKDKRQRSIKLSSRTVLEAFSFRTFEWFLHIILSDLSCLCNKISPSSLPGTTSGVIVTVTSYFNLLSNMGRGLSWFKWLDGSLIKSMIQVHQVNESVFSSFIVCMTWLLKYNNLKSIYAYDVNY